MTAISAAARTSAYALIFPYPEYCKCHCCYYNHQEDNTDHIHRAIPPAIANTRSDMIQARMHWKITRPTAHLEPSSLFTEAMAAMQGVYSRQNVRSAAAEGTVSASSTEVSVPKRTIMDETTFSFARKPDIRAVTILQSESPCSVNTGAITPATDASMLC